MVMCDPDAERVGEKLFQQTQREVRQEAAKNKWEKTLPRRKKKDIKMGKKIPNE